MKIRFLHGFDLIELHKPFLHAFSDYLVPMNLNRDQFQELLIRRGARNDISVAAFDKDEIIGFTLNAFSDYQNVPTVYDVVTGIIPESRNKGIAKRLFHFSLAPLKTIGAARYVLEVFENNLAAVHLYQKIGFSIVRRLEIFVRRPSSNTRMKHSFMIREIEADWFLFQKFWNWQPSWQNSILSIHRSQAQKLVFGIFEESALIGYAVLFPETGDIAQFAIHPNHRRKQAGTALLQHLQSLVGFDKFVRIVNVDEDSEGTILFLKKIGFDLFGSQHEMALALEQ